MSKLTMTFDVNPWTSEELKTQYALDLEAEHLRDCINRMKKLRDSLGIAINDEHLIAEFYLSYHKALSEQKRVFTVDVVHTTDELVSLFEKYSREALCVLAKQYFMVTECRS